MMVWIVLWPTLCNYVCFCLCASLFSSGVCVLPVPVNTNAWCVQCLHAHTRGAQRPANRWLPQGPVALSPWKPSSYQPQSRTVCVQFECECVFVYMHKYKCALWRLKPPVEKPKYFFFENKETLNGC